MFCLIFFLWQELAIKNSANIYKKNFPHQTGRTSFIVFADELTSMGKTHDNLELWISSRSRGKGPEDEYTKDTLAFLNRELKKVPEEQRTAAVRDAICTSALRNKRKCKGAVDKAASSSI